jgi:hypothetical protein
MPSARMSTIALLVLLPGLAMAAPAAASWQLAQTAPPRPTPPQQRPAAPPPGIDSPIQGLPRVGEEGATATDVEILQRAARQFLDEGRCKRIDYGDRAMSKPNTYVISCDGRNIIFMPADLKGPAVR